MRKIKIGLMLLAATFLFCACGENRLSRRTLVHAVFVSQTETGKRMDFLCGMDPEHYRLQTVEGENWPEILAEFRYTSDETPYFGVLERLYVQTMLPRAELRSAGEALLQEADFLPGVRVAAYQNAPAPNALNTELKGLRTTFYPVLGEDDLILPVADAKNMQAVRIGTNGNEAYTEINAAAALVLSDSVSEVSFQTAAVEPVLWKNASAAVTQRPQTAQPVFEITLYGSLQTTAQDLPAQLTAACAELFARQLPGPHSALGAAQALNRCKLGQLPLFYREKAGFSRVECTSQLKLL